MSLRLKVALIILVVLTSGAVWRWLPRRPTAAPPRPNVLLISLDTLRPDHLGCLGYAKPTSPNLDRFAKSGVLFSQARAQEPWTIPSHLSLFTSMLPSTGHFDSAFLALSPTIATLPQVLQHAGYHTVGIVDGGGLETPWGFSRGYDAYHEFAHDDPESRADELSARAVRWLDTEGRAPGRPWYLFMHYYDLHTPYRSTEPFRSRFGAMLHTEAEDLFWTHLEPNQPFANPEDLARLMGSYDAAVATIDNEVGKVLAHVPPNTLVVIFSDHGEAFKEHQWLWHGSTVYEEEVRCTLMMRPPIPEGGQAPRSPRGAKPPGGRLVTGPVMLIDVAPTVLAYCGISAPPTYEGLNLIPYFDGQALPERLLPEMCKSYRAERVSRGLILPPWKLIHNMLTGENELYKLPDEHTNLIATQGAMAKALLDPLQRWVSKSSFWRIDFVGDSEITGTLAVRDGQLSNILPIGLSPAEGSHVVMDRQGGGPVVGWDLKPGGKVKTLYVETLPEDAHLDLKFEFDHQDHPDWVFAGQSGAHPAAMPSEFWIGPTTGAPPTGRGKLFLGEADLSPPMGSGAFRPDRPGVYIRRFAATQPGGEARQASPTIDNAERRRLKSLGYMQ